MPRPGKDPTGSQSTVKMIFSFGSNMTSDRIGVVEAEVNQLERGSAEGDRPVVIDRLIGNHRVGILDLFEALLGFLCAMNVAPASLNGLPPAMWSKWW